MNIAKMLLIPCASALLCTFADAQPHTAMPARIADLPTPAGYSRMVIADESFGAFIRSLPLKRDMRIHAWNGAEIVNPMYSVLAVVDAPLLFKADLEQCADFCMRFWADWHRARGRTRELALFDFGGKRVRLATSGLSERNFLRRAFAYSNSHSLKKGCVEVPESELCPGDLVVQNERGGIGHVSMIVDACESKKGERLYLIGFGFMPAQEFHIERASAGEGLGGWFTLKGFESYLSEKLNVGRPVLRRF